MKKINLIPILISLVIYAVPPLVSVIHGQTFWKPSDLRIRVLAFENYHEKQAGGGSFNSYDSSGQRNATWEGMYAPILLDQGHYNTPSFIVKPNSNSRYEIALFLDTVIRRATHFTLSYHYSGSYSNFSKSGSGEDTLYVSFFNMPYEMIGDSILKIDLQGKSFFGDIENFTYTSSGHESYHWRQDGYEKNYERNSLKVIQDSSSYCSLLFKKTSITSGVIKAEIKNRLLISTSFPDNTINFSLPSTAHPETLFIYDILGREIVQEEIPDGITQYSMNSSRFSSGHYFARIGSMSGHFEVY